MRCTECSRNLKPVAAVDIDGTLAMYHETVTAFSARYFDRPAPTFPFRGDEPFRDYLELTQAEHRAMKLAFRQGGNKRFLKPYPGALDLPQSLRSYGADVWVATTRPWDRLDNVDPDTREWLRRNDVVVDGLLYGEDKYAQLVAAVDSSRIVAAFDDLPEQMLAGQALGLPMFQIYRPHNESVRYVGGDINQAIWFGQEAIEKWRKEHERR